MTDEVGKIEFPKMAHIAQLVYDDRLERRQPGSLPGARQQGAAEREGAGGKIEK